MISIGRNGTMENALVGLESLVDVEEYVSVGADPEEEVYGEAKR